ncbi:hypothetical protein OLT15_01180, partial [Campylobacter jejuni]|nr:hypothetical protein [Campylobacter jejuni]
LNFMMVWWGYYFESPNNLEYQCKIEKDTQILSQEQIISYVKELYSKNTMIIKIILMQSIKTMA